MTLAGSRAAGRWIVAGIAMVFGALTLVAGSQALFGGPAAKALAGTVVPFVLWFNFLSGFVYVIAGMGIALRKRWSGNLVSALVFAILAVFALFCWHVVQGGAYEMRTVGAMALRAVVWIGIAVWLRRSAGQGRLPI